MANFNKFEIIHFAHKSLTTYTLCKTYTIISKVHILETENILFLILIDFKLHKLLIFNDLIYLFYYCFVNSIKN